MILGSEAITRITYAAGTRGSDGRWVQGSSTSTTIYASVQPMEGQDLEILEEGERARDGKRLYTATVMETANQHLGTSADLVTIDSINYEVRQVKRERSIIPHYRVLVMRVQEA